jgi:hypothetical protein
MRRIILFLAIFVLLSSCKEEVVKKPERLIERGVMVDIMYDLSLLEAIKYQNLASVEAYETDPSRYIYKKYKIDSLQFAQNNIYYASNYKEYKDIFDQISKRLDRNKVVVDSLIKIKKKRKKKKSPALKKALKESLRKKDSLLNKKSRATKEKFVKKTLVNIEN